MKIGSYGPRNRAQVSLGGPHKFPWHPDPIAIFFWPNNSELKPKSDDGKIQPKLPHFNTSQYLPKYFITSRDHIFSLSFFGMS